MERAGVVTAGTDQSSGCVVGNGCLLGGHTRQGDDPAGGIGADTAYGDIASTMLIFVIFIVAFIWAKRTRKTGRAQGTYVHDEWLEDSLREEDDWRHLQDLHRRFND